VHDDAPKSPPAKKPPTGPPAHDEGGHPPPAAPPTAQDKAMNRANQAHMAMSAMLDFKRYNEEYKKDYLAQGLSDADADLRANAKASLRAGISLGANLKGGKFGGAVNFANAFINAEQSGQSKPEAAVTGGATVLGGVIGNKVAPSGPVGTAIQVLNTGAQLLGAPQAVQDVTYGAAELVPSSIVSTTITAGARSWYHLGVAAVTGDAKGIDHLGKEMSAGGLGPWLQGYAQMTGMVADIASGDDFTKALDKAAKPGEGSWASRVAAGDATHKGLADYAFDLGQSKEALGGKYGPVVGGYAVMLNMAATMARGEGFSKAMKDANRDANAGQKIVKAQFDAKAAEFKASVKAKVDAVKSAVKSEVHEVKTAVVTAVSDAQAKVAEKVEQVKAAVAARVEVAETALANSYNNSKASAKRYWNKLF
jgi:hypothetical protein